MSILHLPAKEILEAAAARAEVRFLSLSLIFSRSLCLSLSAASLSCSLRSLLSSLRPLEVVGRMILGVTTASGGGLAVTVADDGAVLCLLLAASCSAEWSFCRWRTQAAGVENCVPQRSHDSWGNSAPSTASCSNQVNSSRFYR